MLLHTEVLRTVAPPCLVEVTGHSYTVLSDESFQIVSLYSLRRPISALMSASSFKGSPRWALTLINRVVAPACTLCSSFSMMALRTSASGDLERFSFAPPPIHLWIGWRVASLSVKYYFSYPHNPVYTRCMDPSVLAFSLSLHRHPRIRIPFSYRFICCS